MTKQPHHQKQEERERDRISRLLIYLNDALAMENASVETLQSRTEETEIEELKIALQKHLQETRQQQERLEQIITNIGGKPTEEKAGLPILTVNEDHRQLCPYCSCYNSRSNSK